MSFKKYIKAVGTGPKGNRDLEESEIFDAITQILKKEVSNEQIGAFLIGLRVKLESDSELLGALKACKEFIKQDNNEDSFELGYSFDGKTKTPYLFPLYGKILKDFFAKNPQLKPFDLIISVDDLQPATDGVIPKNLVEELELEDNIKVYDRKKYFKELHDLTELRMNLGLRTVFNTIEKLLNPANSKYALTSAFHKPYVKKYSNIFASSYEKFVVVKGKEGAPEFFDKCQYWIVEGDEIKDYTIDMNELGINPINELNNISVDDVCTMVSEPSDDLLKLAKFNVAFLLFISGRVEDIVKTYKELI